MLDGTAITLDVKSEDRAQRIAKLKEAFDNCCCEIRPDHSCSCSCEACLATIAIDTLEGSIK